MRTWTVLLLLLGAGTAPAQEAAGFDHGHGAWQRLLQTYVHKGGLVDYAGLARADRPALDAYLRALAAVTGAEFQGWSPAQREAFWINAYNAYTVGLILDHYPVDSIKDIGGVFSSVFNREFVPLQHLVPRMGQDEALTLGQIEHEILARDFELPLFHFAIVCASYSCPELLDQAYTAERLAEQLAAQARKFLGDAAKNDQKPDGSTLRISKIFDWSEGELEKYPGGIAGILRDFGPAEVAKSPQLGRFKLKYRDYDWSLNEWKAPGAR